VIRGADTGPTIEADESRERVLTANAEARSGAVAAAEACTASARAALGAISASPAASTAAACQSMKRFVITYLPTLESNAEARFLTVEEGARKALHPTHRTGSVCPHLHCATVSRLAEIWKSYQ